MNSETADDAVWATSQRTQSIRLRGGGLIRAGSGGKWAGGRATRQEGGGWGRGGCPTTGLGVEPAGVLAGTQFHRGSWQSTTSGVPRQAKVCLSFCLYRHCHEHRRDLLSATAMPSPVLGGLSRHERPFLTLLPTFLHFWAQQGLVPSWNAAKLCWVEELVSERFFGVGFGSSTGLSHLEHEGSISEEPARAGCLVDAYRRIWCSRGGVGPALE